MGNLVRNNINTIDTSYKNERLLLWLSRIIESINTMLMIVTYILRNHGALPTTGSYLPRANSVFQELHRSNTIK